MHSWLAWRWPRPPWLGAGCTVHFGAELFTADAGFAVELQHFRSGQEATGRIKALALTAPRRSPLMPGVPTFAEVGLPGVSFTSWFARFAPAGTPEAAQQALERAFLAVIRSAERQRRLHDRGLVPLVGDAAQARALVCSETERWASIPWVSG